MPPGSCMNIHSFHYKAWHCTETPPKHILYFLITFPQLGSLGVWEGIRCGYFNYYSYWRGQVVCCLANGIHSANAARYCSYFRCKVHQTQGSSIITRSGMNKCIHASGTLTLQQTSLVTWQLWGEFSPKCFHHRYGFMHSLIRCYRHNHWPHIYSPTVPWVVCTPV